MLRQGQGNLCLSKFLYSCNQARNLQSRLLLLCVRGVCVRAHHCGWLRELGVVWGWVCVDVTRDVKQATQVHVAPGPGERGGTNPNPSFFRHTLLS